MHMPRLYTTAAVTKAAGLCSYDDSVVARSIPVEGGINASSAISLQSITHFFFSESRLCIRLFITHRRIFEQVWLAQEQCRFAIVSTKYENGIAMHERTYRMLWDLTVFDGVLQLAEKMNEQRRM